MAKKPPAHFPDWDENKWFSLGCLLSSQRANKGSLATAIEQEGIYTWDRFGRFIKREGKDAEEALDLLADLATTPGYYTSDTEVSENNDPTITYGWAESVCPDFEKYYYPNPEPPTNKNAETNSRRTLLCIIGALANQAKIDLDERGVAKKIMQFTEETGSPISDETIRKLLPEIREAVEMRSK